MKNINLRHNLNQILLNSFIFAVIFISVVAQSEPLESLRSQPAGVIPVIEAASPESHDTDFLKKFRSELNAQQAKDHERAEKRGPVLNATIRVVPENMTFFIANGGVYFLTMMTQTNSDPALMVKHIESLKDPVGLISFYSFMVANGVYVNFKTKGMDPMTKQLAMRSLQYKGMAVGSLASSITADIISTLSACSDTWIKNKNDEQSHAVCDDAYKNWTLRNKSTQYIPQILSLIASQAGAEAVDHVAKGAIKNKITSSAFQKVETSALKLFKISSANIGLFITPGGPIVKSISWLGKVTQFGVFLAVDHLITPSVMRIGNNILQPFFFQFDVNALEKSLKNKSIDAPKEIENFTYRMQQWRMHLNSKVDMSLDGWQTEVDKLLHQIDFSKNFYRSYLKNLKETQLREAAVQNGDFASEPERAWSTQAKYPYRTLPLYGVESGRDFKEEKETDLYLTKPWLIERYQHENLQKIAGQFLLSIKKYNLDSKSEKQTVQLLNGLNSNSSAEQGKYLVQLNQRIGRFYDQNVVLSFANYNLLRDLRIAIGNPLPILDIGAGFSQAYMLSETNLQIAKTADFALKNSSHVVNKASDLMLYNMICGSDTAIVSEEYFYGLNFTPPRLSIADPKKSNLCYTRGLFKNTVDTLSLYRYKTILQNQSVSMTDYLISQINTNLDFETWWNQKTLSALNTKFKDLDIRYKTLVTEAYGNILDQKTFGDFALDMYTHWSTRLQGNILDNLNFELEFYTTTLDRIVHKKPITDTHYIDSLITKSLAEKFNSVNNLKTSEISNLKKSYKDLIALLQNHEVVDINRIEGLNSKLLAANDAMFSELKKYEGQANLPPEISSLFSIRKGLEALEIDIKRYLFLKVNLADRLEIGVAQMKEFMDKQK